MPTYTVAITRDGHNAQMIVRIDDSSGMPRICELAIRPVDGKSLAADELPTIDLAMLLRSLQQPAATKRRSAAPLNSLAQTTPPTVTRPTPARSRTAAKATTARERRRQPATGAVEVGRAYRRMPEDIAAVFARTGGVTAVARHYGVPRHTAQGWIGRLRRQG